MLSIDDTENSIFLHRIKLLGGNLSLVRLADLSRGERDQEQGEIGWKKMLPAMSPLPVFSYARANRSVGAPTRLPKPPFFVLNIPGDLVSTSSGSVRMEQ